MTGDREHGHFVSCLLFFNILPGEKRIWIRGTFFARFAFSHTNIKHLMSCPIERSDGSSFWQLQISDRDLEIYTDIGAGNPDFILLPISGYSGISNCYC